MLIEKEFVIDDISYYKNIDSSSICFDIETTGLNKIYSHITVIGTGFVKDDRIIFRQWLLDDPSDEKEMLSEFSDYLKQFSSLIQFNGNSFDIPYTSKRCALHGLDDPFADMSLIDLYVSAKHLKKISALDNLKQKSLETLFKIERRDRISGRDCIFAYQDYLKYRNLRARDALLLHNEEDVLGLLKICSLKNVEEIADSFKLTGADISDNIIFTFDLKSELPFEISHAGAEYSVEIFKDKGSLTLYPLFCTRKYFFSNYKDYYYLPDEDRAIHKSVGAYVDPAHRQKALKANCYEKIEDCFFRQYSDAVQPAFKEDIKDKTFWFRLSDIKKAPAEQIYALCRGWLKYIFLM